MISEEKIVLGIRLIVSEDRVLSQLKNIVYI